MHVSVLPNEVIDYLKPQSGDTVIDCTLGLGGHSKLILEHIGPSGLLIGIDQDEDNLTQAKENLQGHQNVYFVLDNFENLAEIVDDVAKIAGKQLSIDKILFDLGLSSRHVDNPERGFSFLREGPLDMRFDARQKLTALHLVNNAPLTYLIKIFKLYGQEPHAQRIAKAIVQERRNTQLQTTTQLGRLIENVVRGSGKHPGTRVFQALRIAVNRELEVVENALQQAMNLVAVGGRIAVISFHSLEDRITKNIFRDYSKREELPQFQLLTKKPVAPTEEEMHNNSRSRSAKLRAVERIA